MMINDNRLCFCIRVNDVLFLAELIVTELFHLRYCREDPTANNGHRCTFGNTDVLRPHDNVTPP